MMLRQGRASRTGSALVEINVDDVNDERPVFNQKVYVFRVWENELPGTNVIRLNSLPLLSFVRFIPTSQTIQCTLGFFYTETVLEVPNIVTS